MADYVGSIVKIQMHISIVFDNAKVGNRKEKSK